MNILAVMVLLAANTVFELESNGSGFFELPNSVWVAPGTIIAVAGEDTLEAVSAVSGIRMGLRINPPPPAGTIVRFEFDTLPLVIPPSVKLETAFLERTEMGIPARTQVDPALDYGLFISGSKRIGLSVGEGGGLDQGTRIMVEGMAAPGISVSGSVTDRNLSAGPASSELVAQLDRVLFKVDGGVWAVRLGDMEWQRGCGDIGPLAWRRDVSGVDIDTSVLPGLKVGAGYGTVGDSRSRTVFHTVEGVQGPYEITSGMEVVPGSEKVRLDGELLERGAAADYEMDYAAGFLTFTAGRLIRKDQRVEVTFFQRGDGFRKDLVTASVIASHGPVGIDIAGLRLRDNKNSPIGFILTDEATGVLENALEDPSEAWIDGATHVGAGNGSYNLDPLGHYLYVGSGRGEWSVVFGRPPEGAGDYLYDSSIGGFVWAGEGNGTHFPRVYIRIPIGYETGGIGAAVETAGLEGGFEAAVSRRTGNLFNSGETTREGTFLAGNFLFDLWEEGAAIGLSGRLVSSGYRPPGELEADSSLASWRLPLHHRGNDDIVEATVGGEALRVAAAGRYMEAGGHLERYRLAARSLRGRIEVNVNGTFVGRDAAALARGDYSRLACTGSLGIGFFRPFAGISRMFESWEDSLSGPVNTGYVGLSFERGNARSLLRFEVEKDDRTGEATDPSTSLRGRLESSGVAAAWNFSGSAEHSTTLHRGGGRLHADAISMTAVGTPGGIWMQSVYSGSGTISRLLDVVYTWVGEGEGSYGYDPETGLYYPDPDGDYDRSYRPGSAGEVITRATLETTFMASGKTGGFSGVLRLASGSGDDRLKGLLLFGAFETSREGGYDADLSRWWNYADGIIRRLALTGRVRNERISFSGAGLSEERSWSLEIAPVLQPSDMLVVDCMAKVWRDEDELFSPRDIRGVRIELAPALVIAPGTEPGLHAAVERRTEEYAGLDAIMYETGPKFSWRKGGWTSSARITASYIPGDETLPSWLFDGRAPGVSWKTSGRISRSIASGFDITLHYRGRMRPGREWINSAALDGTISF